MEQFLRKLNTIPEVAELIGRVEEGGCPAAVTGLQPVPLSAAMSGRPGPWRQIWGS